MEKLYDITIIETLEKTVRVKAETSQEATDMVIEDYYSENIILTADDYNGRFEVNVQEVEESD